MAGGTDLRFILREGISPTGDVEISTPMELLMFEILLSLKRLRTVMERSVLPELQARRTGSRVIGKSTPERPTPAPGKDP